MYDCSKVMKKKIHKWKTLGLINSRQIIVTPTTGSHINYIFFCTKFFSYEPFLHEARCVSVARAAVGQIESLSFTKTTNTESVTHGSKDFKLKISSTTTGLFCYLNTHMLTTTVFLSFSLALRFSHPPLHFSVSPVIVVDPAESRGLSSGSRICAYGGNFAFPVLRSWFSSYHGKLC